MNRLDTRLNRLEQTSSTPAAQQELARRLVLANLRAPSPRTRERLIALVPELGEHWSLPEDEFLSYAAGVVARMPAGTLQLGALAGLASAMRRARKAHLELTA